VQGGGLRYLSPWVLCAVVLGLTMVWGESPRVYLVILAARIVLNPLLLMSTILHSGSLLTRFLELPPLKFVGRISYSVYLWQSLFLTRSTVYPGWIGRLQHPLIGAICTFVCAIASFYLIETPMIRLGRRFVTNRKKLDDPAEPNPLAA
jgi:peptidoglycan/LPS O-acetylase OafA/YrhL